MAPKGTPPAVVKYLHDAAKAAIDEPSFLEFTKKRVISVDYRPEDRLRADLWKEYRSHTEILTRAGLLKK
jgi:tripartite-type tricarboxylate transporter receptor subunit TctC